MKAPKTIRLDEAIEKDIALLMPASGMEDFSSMARHLFRLGIQSERERQRVLSGRPVAAKLPEARS